MAKIIVLEGADGTGKTTLAREIANQTLTTIIHAYYDPEWNMENYHSDIIDAADLLRDYQVVVLDRWAPSEAVYGKVFRGGESYNTDALIEDWKDDITWIYCHNDKVVENHLKNQKTRTEMFSDMTNIVKEFDKYIRRSNLSWIMYDYNVVHVHDFVKELLR